MELMTCKGLSDFLNCANKYTVLFNFLNVVEISYLDRKIEF